MHMQRQLASSAACPALDSELSAPHLTATDRSKVSRGKRGERKCRRMTRRVTRGLSGLKVEAQAPVAA